MVAADIVNANKEALLALVGHFLGTKKCNRSVAEEVEIWVIIVVAEGQRWSRSVKRLDAGGVNE